LAQFSAVSSEDGCSIGSVPIAAKMGLAIAVEARSAVAVSVAFRRLLGHAVSVDQPEQRLALGGQQLAHEH
jgi:hypothetical protein